MSFERFMNLGFQSSPKEPKENGLDEEIAAFSSISRLLLKSHHSDVYEAKVACNLANSLRRYIIRRPTAQTRTKKFIDQVRRDILSLHDYCLQVAKTVSPSKYPQTKLHSILIQYIELECSLLDESSIIDKAKETATLDRVLRFVRTIIVETLSDDFSLKRKLETCDKIVLKLFVDVMKDTDFDNQLIPEAITRLIGKLNLLDQVNQLKDKQVAYQQDQYLQDPLVSALRKSLITSDYESDLEKDDDVIAVDIFPKKKWKQENHHETPPKKLKPIKEQQSGIITIDLLDDDFNDFNTRVEQSQHLLQSHEIKLEKRDESRSPNFSIFDSNNQFLTSDKAHKSTDAGLDKSGKSSGKSTNGLIESIEISDSEEEVEETVETVPNYDSLFSFKEVEEAVSSLLNAVEEEMLALETHTEETEVVPLEVTSVEETNTNEDEESVEEQISLEVQPKENLQLSVTVEDSLIEVDQCDISTKEVETSPPCEELEENDTLTKEVEATAEVEEIYTLSKEVDESDTLPKEAEESISLTKEVETISEVIDDTCKELEASLILNEDIEVEDTSKELDTTMILDEDMEVEEDASSKEMDTTVLLNEDIEVEERGSCKEIEQSDTLVTNTEDSVILNDDMDIETVTIEEEAVKGLEESYTEIEEPEKMEETVGDKHSTLEEIEVAQEPERSVEVEAHDNEKEQPVADLEINEIEVETEETVAEAELEETVRSEDKTSQETIDTNLESKEGNEEESSSQEVVLEDGITSVVEETVESTEEESHLEAVKEKIEEIIECVVEIENEEMALPIDYSNKEKEVEVTNLDLLAHTADIVAQTPQKELDYAKIVEEAQTPRRISKVKPSSILNSNRRNFKEEKCSPGDFNSNQSAFFKSQNVKVYVQQPAIINNVSEDSNSSSDNLFIDEGETKNTEHLEIYDNETVWDELELIDTEAVEDFLKDCDKTKKTTDHSIVNLLKIEEKCDDAAEKILITKASVKEYELQSFETNLNQSEESSVSLKSIEDVKEPVKKESKDKKAQKELEKSKETVKKSKSPSRNDKKSDSHKKSKRSDSDSERKRRSKSKSVEHSRRDRKRSQSKEETHKKTDRKENEREKKKYDDKEKKKEADKASESKSKTKGSVVKEETRSHSVDKDKHKSAPKKDSRKDKSRRSHSKEKTKDDKKEKREVVKEQKHENVRKSKREPKTEEESSPKIKDVQDIPLPAKHKQNIETCNEQEKEHKEKTEILKVPRKRKYEPEKIDSDEVSKENLFPKEKTSEKIPLKKRKSDAMEKESEQLRTSEKEKINVDKKHNVPKEKNSEKILPKKRKSDVIEPEVKQSEKNAENCNQLDTPMEIDNKEPIDEKTETEKTFIPTSEVEQVSSDLPLIVENDKTPVVETLATEEITNVLNAVLPPEPEAVSISEVLPSEALVTAEVLDPSKVLVSPTYEVLPTAQVSATPETLTPQPPETSQPSETEQPEELQPSETLQPTEVSEPILTEQPETLQPIVTEQPEALQPPETSQPIVTEQPETLQPIVTEQPETSQPIVTEQPEALQPPETSQPIEAEQPEALQPPEPSPPSEALVQPEALPTETIPAPPEVLPTAVLAPPEVLPLAAPTQTEENLFNLAYTRIVLEDNSPTKLEPNPCLDFISPSTSSEISNPMRFVQTLGGVAGATDVLQPPHKEEYSGGDPLVGGNNEDRNMLSSVSVPLTTNSPEEDFSINDSPLEGFCFSDDNIMVVSENLKQLDELLDNSQISLQKENFPITNIISAHDNADLRSDVVDDVINNLLRVNRGEDSIQNDFGNVPQYMDNFIDQSSNESAKDTASFKAEEMKNEIKVITQPIEQCLTITSVDQLSKSFEGKTKSRFCRLKAFKDQVRINTAKPTEQTQNKPSTTGLRHNKPSKPLNYVPQAKKDEQKSSDGARIRCKDFEKLLKADGEQASDKNEMEFHKLFTKCANQAKDPKVDSEQKSEEKKVEVVADSKASEMDKTFDKLRSEPPVNKLFQQKSPTVAKVEVKTPKSEYFTTQWQQEHRDKHAEKSEHKRPLSDSDLKVEKKRQKYDELPLPKFVHERNKLRQSNEEWRKRGYNTVKEYTTLTFARDSSKAHVSSKDFSKFHSTSKEYFTSKRNHASAIKSSRSAVPPERSSESTSQSQTDIWATMRNKLPDFQDMPMDLFPPKS